MSDREARYRETARKVVVLSGFPEAVVAAAEAHGVTDWRRLAGTLDSLFMALGGSLGVIQTLGRPAAALDDRTPAAVLQATGDVERVADYLHAEVLRINRARVGY